MTLDSSQLRLPAVSAHLRPRSLRLLKLATTVTQARDAATSLSSLSHHAATLAAAHWSAQYFGLPLEPPGPAGRVKGPPDGPLLEFQADMAVALPRGPGFLSVHHVHSLAPLSVYE